MKNKILIIGGYGRAGRQIAELLLRQKPELNIVLSGRNLKKAKGEPTRINHLFSSKNVHALLLDATDKIALSKAFGNVDLIVNAASTIEQNSIVAEAVLESGKDYLDTQLSSPTKHDVLFRNADNFMRKNIFYVTDAGFHPGLPATLGQEKCQPMFLEEMKVLVGQLPNLQEAGFYITGFNKFLDNWLLPIIYPGILLVPKKWAWPFVKLFQWGSRFIKPPHAVKLVSECTGIKDNQTVNIRIEMANTDEYFLTATPTVACLLQLLDGTIRKPGLWFASNLVEPQRFISDIERMGVEYEIHCNGRLLERSNSLTT